MQVIVNYYDAKMLVCYAPQSVIDDFDYGDDDDDASRIAEQRRHLMEEERRLSQE